MSEVIVVTSGKGGVGKTTTTANIGTGLAKLGKKVVLIDTNAIEKPRIAFGADQRQTLSGAFRPSFRADKR